jgi:hypothetical protein
MTRLAASIGTAPLALVVVAALLTGCTSDPAAAAKASQAPADAVADVSAPPKQLVQDVKRVLTSPPVSLGVESEDRGTLVTGWKRFQGDWHIARHWQERTRYVVEVSPDWEEPTARARLRVTAETEQRAAEGQRWDREVRVPRPQRAQDLLKRILEQLDAGKRG